jgi:hypothetical protein
MLKVSACLALLASVICQSLHHIRTSSVTVNFCKVGASYYYKVLTT